MWDGAEVRHGSLNPLAVLVLALISSGSLGNPTVATEPEIERALNTWREYQGIEVKGTSQTIRSGKKHPLRRFRLCFGRSFKDRGLVPRSLESFIENPGEPHFTEPWICDWYSTVSKGTVLDFRRVYFSANSNYEYHNSISVTPGNFSANVGRGYEDAGVGFIDAMIASDLMSFAYSDQFSTIGEFEKNVDLKIVGEEEFLGVNGKIIEMKLKGTEHDEFTKSETYRSLVAFEPTVRILKYYDITGPNEEHCELINKSRRPFKIKKLEVISGMLIPTLVELESDEIVCSIEIDEVNRLPESFHGLWEADAPTGTKWQGEFAKTIFKDGIHVRDPFAGIIIPYTEQETEAIRQYLVKKRLSLPERGLDWWSILFYLAGFATVGCLSLVVYRKYKEG
jgi:hypothetical protein